ncbi:membrane protein insertion efficiency factor YidD [Psychrosphaera sp. B3R10]|uniref:Putative membrane protein insertion efficiency factor n=1 Tax=Psychrosphaera algicola TaxID=3023714 RepID=A0ABT5FGH8_9GAMM|nr:MULTISPECIES: membrane protein insertion efficiency factor YidD [unclassified Psychrosphaera]MBU2883302.1 membrane protein insertion efficiency factor YidD [Psychrosphaera sp. I2R16]MBU2990604.1 membrane protein insertion efficiency factor YidD [Psychrosphaera sp. B3R10]MDC2889851.1 membrane protein insertion efficiency factor YidD [Psychrosphaera sp. G1-22]MDO6718922.1 membrane protein insertion efficiency factor YidD [Psychrosphaera sp. 1_MG-2023]
MRTILKALIRFYQTAISPWFGAKCRFYPSCSNYALEAIEIHGASKGTWLSIKRILKCQPLTEGGFDPVPNSSKSNKDKE